MILLAKTNTRWLWRRSHNEDPLFSWLEEDTLWVGLAWVHKNCGTIWMCAIYLIQSCHQRENLDKYTAFRSVLWNQAFLDHHSRVVYNPDLHRLKSQIKFWEIREGFLCMVGLHLRYLTLSLFWLSHRYMIYVVQESIEYL